MELELDDLFLLYYSNVRQRPQKCFTIWTEFGGGVIQLINNRNACKLDLLSIRIRGFEAIHGRHLSFTFAYTLVTFILFGSFWFVRSFTFHSSPRFLLHRTHTHTHTHWPKTCELGLVSFPVSPISRTFLPKT